MRITYIFFLLLLAFIQGIAQNDFRTGYIMTLQGDTVEGLVNYSLAKFRTCEFKVQETSPVSEHSEYFFYFQKETLSSFRNQFVMNII